MFVFSFVELVLSSLTVSVWNHCGVILIVRDDVVHLARQLCPSGATDVTTMVRIKNKKSVLGSLTLPATLIRIVDLEL